MRQGVSRLSADSPGSGFLAHGSDRSAIMIQHLVAESGILAGRNHMVERGMVDLLA